MPIDCRRVSMWVVGSVSALAVACGGTTRIGPPAGDDTNTDGGQDAGGDFAGGGGAGGGDVTEPAPGGCAVDADCSGGRRCDRKLGQCVQCLRTSDCPGGETCSKARVCVPAPGAGGFVGSGGVSIGGFPVTGGFPAAGGYFGDGGSTGGASAGGYGSGGRVFDAGTDPERNRVPAGKACERLATIQCAGDGYCCPNGVRSFERCMQTAVSVCQYLDQLSASSMVAYDIDRAEQAFAGFEKRASECDPGIVGWALGDAGFRTVVRGTVPPGGDCTPVASSSDPIEQMARLLSCSEPEKYGCMPDFTTVTASCSPRGGVGAHCYMDLTCLDGLYCEMFGDPTQATCKKRLANGSACNYPGQCESMRCEGAVCIPSDARSVYCLSY